MADFGVAAFSVFFMQSPSFLAHQRALAKGRGRGLCNLHTLFGLTKVPCDIHIGDMLDGAPTAPFDAVFLGLARDLDKAGGLRPFRRLGGGVLIALDGSEHFASRKIHCPQCSRRKRADGETGYFHTFLGATLVAPGHRHVLPLPPEFVRPQDGADKQDCESRAVQRWLKRVGPRYAWLKPVYLGDDLHAHQPTCEAILAVGGSFLLACKPSSHQTLAKYLRGVDLDHCQRIEGKGSAKRVFRYRWMNGIPIRDGDDALSVNWLELEISKPNGKLTGRHSFIVDSCVDAPVDASRFRTALSM